MTQIFSVFICKFDGKMLLRNKIKIKSGTLIRRKKHLCIEEQFLSCAKEVKIWTIIEIHENNL